MSDLAAGTPSRSSKRKPSANGQPEPLEDLLHALQAMRSGDFSVRMTGDHLGPPAPGPRWKAPSTR